MDVADLSGLLRVRELARCVLVHHSTMTMQAAYAKSTFIRPVRKTSLVRSELPSELDEAIASDVYLRPMFERLSDLQKECYIDWISSGDDTDARTMRATLVCSVIRSLADVMVGIDVIAGVDLI